MLTTSARLYFRRYLGPVPRRRRSAGSFPEQRLVIEPRYAVVRIAPHCSISSRALEIEALSFAVKRFRKKTKNTQNPNRV